MRLFWLLPKAAPALLRHAAAYVDLAALDLARAQREIGAQLVAAAVIAMSVLFALMLGCIAVIAYTWDTSYRVTAVACMAGAFLCVAVIAAIYRARAARARSELLAGVRQQWQEDRVLLEKILSADEERPFRERS